MANLNKTIDIVFGAKDKTGSVFSSVTGGIDSIAGPVADLTKKFLLFEAAILAVGVAFAAKAFSESVKYESALLDLQKVMTVADGDVKQFSGTIDEMSNKYGEAAAEILQGAANFKQAGFDVTEAFELQRTALDLVVAGDIGAAQASELLVATLKGFKAPASEANRLADIQNEISNKYATNLEQLAIGMAQFSPIAAKMNLGFEDTAALLTPIIEVFRSGSEAATALKMSFLRLVSDQKPVLEALDKLGVSQRDVNGHMRTGKDIMMDVAKAFETVAETEKLKMAAELTGIRQTGKAVEVFDGLAKVIEITNTAMNAYGSIAKEVAIRLAASEKQIDRAKVAFNNMARAIGDTFRPELTGVISSITEVEIALQKITEAGGFEPLLKIIRPQLEEWKDTLSKIAGALPAAFDKLDWTPITKALQSLGVTFDGLFDGLDLTKADDLAEVFNRIIKVSGTMIEVTGGIIKVFGEVGAVIIKAIKWFSDLDPWIQKLIGGIGAASIALTAFTPIIAGVGIAASIAAGPKGIGLLVTVLRSVAGAVGLASGTKGIAKLTSSMKGVAPASALAAGPKGIGLLTKSLIGKAGLVGAVAGASFALGKLIEDSFGIGEKFWKATGIFDFDSSAYDKVTDEEIKAYEGKVKKLLAIRDEELASMARPGENTEDERAARKEEADARTKAYEDVIRHLELVDEAESNAAGFTKERIKAIQDAIAAMASDAGEVELKIKTDAAKAAIKEIEAIQKALRKEAGAERGNSLKRLERKELDGIENVAAARLDVYKMTEDAKGKSLEKLVNKELDGIDNIAYAQMNVYEKAEATNKESLERLAKKAREEFGDIGNVFAKADAVNKESLESLARKAKEEFGDIGNIFAKADSTNKESLESLAKKARDEFGDIGDVFAKADSTNKESLESLAKKAREEFGDIGNIFEKSEDANKESLKRLAEKARAEFGDVGDVFEKFEHKRGNSLERLEKIELDGIENVADARLDVYKMTEDAKGKSLDNLLNKELDGIDKAMDARQTATEMIEDRILETNLALPGENYEHNKEILDGIRDKTAEATDATSDFKDAIGRVGDAWDSVDSGIRDTGDTLSDLVESLTEASSPGQRSQISGIIDAENRRREEQFKLQEELLKQQLALGQERLKRMRSGDALIKISGEGLAPYAKAFIWGLMDEIVISANAEEQDFLLGMKNLN